MALSPRLLFAAGSVAVMLLLPLPGGLDVFDTSIFLIEEDMAQDEDSYVLSQNAVVEGLVDGDLVVASNRVEVSGRVAGDVIVASDGTVTISGDVEGSVRGFARKVVVGPQGNVRDDLAVAAITTRIEGSVGRDVIVFGGKVELTGSIGRDMHGRFIVGEFDGVIGRNTDVATSRLEVGPATSVGGSLLYRSNREADAHPDAVVEGKFARLSPRPSFFIDIWWTLATILGFFAFLFTGIVVMWLWRGTSAAAAGSILHHPWRTLGFGAAALVAVPIVVWLLVRSFVGVPIAILIGVLYLLGFFFGPIPAVTAAGSRLVRGRTGLYGAFVVGAIVWRLGIAVLPIVAGGLYVLALVWGVGGWVAAVWEGRTGRYSTAEKASTTARS